MDKVITETKWNGYNFQQVNESKMEDMGDILAIYAPRNTDYFNSPIKEHGAFPAPIATVQILCRAKQDSKWHMQMIVLRFIIR